MALADLDDINAFLPRDKLQATDGNPEITRLQTDAERVVKGYLRSVYEAAVIDTWISPATTPSLLRAVAGRIVAAFYYRLKLSENRATMEEIAYPQRLYNEAMALLLEIRSGIIVLPEAPLPGTAFDTDYFWPNATTDDPKFTMDMRF